MEFVWILDANNVIVENKGYDIELTEDEINQFREMSQDPNLMSKLVESFSASIFGWTHVKEALLLGIFGGVAKIKDDAEIRGNINVFLLGDPGTAKSQLLKYCHKIAYRSIFSTGRGVTGVGLTAALVKENERFILRAGTMALADMGVACIDEAEKMLKEDRDAVHTPMEQQIIPVNKGGLNTTLNARCATFMAANPTNGRYVQQKTVRENIEDFPDSLLTRFDFIFVMPDIVNPENDEQITDTILQLNQEDKKKHISLTTLKRYIIYSKRIYPTIPEEVKERLKKFFLEKRSDTDNNTGLQISFRQLESLERACEAYARAHLRETVTMEDAEATIKLFEIYVRATWTDPFTGKIDMNVYEGIPAASRQQQADYVPNIIEHMYRDGKGVCDALGELFVRRGDLIKELERLGQLDTFIANKVLDLAIEKDLVWGIDKIKIKGDRNRMLGDEEQSLNT
jgi:replicative DNA helicase Mcm